MLEVSMKNQQRRSKHPSLQQWHSSSRLNSMFHSAASNKPEETEKIALMQRYRQAIKPTVARFDKNTKKTLGRIYLLIEAARRKPFAGIGKPEPPSWATWQATGQGRLMARIAWFTPLTMPILT